MKIKKLTALLLALTAISGFAGCSDKASPSETEISSTAEETTLNLQERLDEASDILAESSKPDLPEGTYELNGFQFDISEKFDSMEGVEDCIAFKGKEYPVSIGFADQALFGNCRAIATAQGIADTIRESGDEAVCEEYDNPYMECARVRSKTSADIYNLEKFSENANLDYYYARQERDMICFLVSYIDDNEDEAEDYVNYILSSLNHVGEEVISDEGGTVENDYYTINYSKIWYPETVTTTPEDVEEAEKNGEEIKQSIKMRFSLVDTEKLMLSGVTFTAVKNSQYSTLEEYANNIYEKATSNSRMSGAEKGEGEIAGHKAIVVSYDLSAGVSFDAHLINYFFEDNGIYYLISENYPNDYDSSCQDDIKELIDNIVLK